MICPECGRQYREGVTRCHDCDVALMDLAPTEPDLALVNVYQSGNPALLPIVESLLRDAGIEFMTKGESVQALQGAIGNPFVVPVEFWVRSNDEAQARAVLAPLEDSIAVEEGE